MVRKMIALELQQSASLFLQEIVQNTKLILNQVEAFVKIMKICTITVLD